MNSTGDVEENLAFIEHSMKSAQRVDLLVLPENFAQMPTRKDDLHIEQVGTGVIQRFIFDLANKYNTVVVAGSIPIYEQGRNKPFSRCIIAGPNGKLAHYDKLHLFDIQTPSVDGKNRGHVYRESDSYQQGEIKSGRSRVTELEIGANTVRIGPSICYDLRFPELYREYSEQRVDIITVPAAFTYETGKSHWECLLRARAIENQCFVLASAQVGEHPNGRQTWGHSMMIDAWGKIISVQAQAPGLLYADLDLHQKQRLSTTFPVLSHKRLT